jgi:pantothenate kinase
MQIPELTFPASLMVTEQAIDLSGLGPAQQAFYRRLLAQIVQRHLVGGTPRSIVGFAGPTGAGKSVVAMLLKELARQAQLPFAFEAITIDAYHFPNAYLLAHFSHGVPLKQVKGRFDTYDVAALVRDLTHFKAGEPVAFPTYSRRLHDPVPAQVKVTTTPTLLLVEGLWLLAEPSGWAAVKPLLDYCYFIEADPERTREGVLRRHMRGGRTLEDATRHYDEVDGKNSALVLTTRNRADEVLPSYQEIGVRR